MRRLLMTILVLGFAASSAASAASCRDDKGKFIKCPPVTHVSKKCRNDKGKFTKCDAPPVKAG